MNSAQFANATKQRQRIEIVNEVWRRGSWGGLDDALLSPAAKHFFAETE